MVSVFEVFQKGVNDTPYKPYIFHTDIISHETQQSNWHQDPEFLYVIEGSGKISYNYKIIPIQKGDIIAINSNAVHQLSSKESMTLHCLIINQDCFYENQIDFSKILFCEKTNDPAIITIFNEFVENISQEEDTYTDAYILATLYRFVIYNIRHNATNNSQIVRDATVTNTQRAQQIIHYIKNHFNEKITIDMLAEHLHLSKFYLSHEFKKATGYTICEIINIIRCDYARIQLAHSAESASAIAEMCGFEEYSYFSNVFKRTVGLSPTEYRKKTKQSPQLY